jgi:hypothetical protein
MDKVVSQFLIFALIILALLFIIGGDHLTFRIFPILTTDAPIQLVQKPTTVIDDSDDVSIIINNNYDHDHKHNQLLGASNPLNLNTTPKAGKDGSSDNKTGTQKPSAGSAPLVGGSGAKPDPNVKNSLDSRKARDLPASGSDNSEENSTDFGSAAPLGDVFSFPSNTPAGSSINSPQSSSTESTQAAIQAALVFDTNVATPSLQSRVTETPSTVSADMSGETTDETSTDTPSPIDSSYITTAYSSAYSDNVTVAPVTVSTFAPTTGDTPTTTFSSLASSSKYTTYSAK